MPLLRSALDTEFASWPVNSPANAVVTDDQAYIGFTPKRWDAPDTWYAADIVVDATTYGDPRPRLRILIGPENGGVALPPGTWHAYGKIVDDPEVPVKYLDYIVIR